MVLNAGFVGQTSVAIPGAFVGRGTSLPTIVAFNILVVATALAANLSIFFARRRLSNGKALTIIGSSAAAIGPLVLCLPITPLAAAPLIALSSIVFPLTLSTLRAADEKSVALSRQAFVGGYIGGLSVFAIISGLGLEWHESLYIATITQGLSLLATWRTNFREGRNSFDADAEPVDGSAPRSVTASIAVVLVAALAVLLMRAGDNIRQSYLPLYIAHRGMPPWTSAVLLASSALAEIAFLPILAMLSRRVSTHALLVISCLLGAFSFAIMAEGGGIVSLLASQVVYAVFLAGYQSLGVVWLQRLLPDSTVGGASLYTVAVQTGSALGLLSALVHRQFTASLFLYGSAFAAAAAICVTLAWGATYRERKLDPLEKNERHI